MAAALMAILQMAKPGAASRQAPSRPRQYGLYASRCSPSGHERRDHLPVDLVRHSQHCHLGDTGVLEDGTLDQEGGDLVAGALDDVDAEGRGGCLHAIIKTLPRQKWEDEGFTVTHIYSGYYTVQQ